MQSPAGRTEAIPPLVDFIPQLQKKYTAPYHLAPLLAVFERAMHEQVKVVVSAPPRHGKTESEIAAIAWTLKQAPHKQISFIGYAARFAEKKSRKARELSIRAGVPIASDAASRQDWRTGVDDGGLWATSIGGQVTGEGFHLMIIDDPVKDRASAESATYRDHAYEWFTDTAYTRLEPTGSCIVTQTRWHPDDLAGRLIADGWEHINLPALDEDGAALWPERWSADRLADIREQLGEYGWASLYQGEPRPRGGAVFGDAHFFESPPQAMRLTIGLDLAYTAKTHADYSVAVVLAESAGVYYVLDVRRMQVAAPAFATALQAVRSSYPGAQIHSYLGGTEKGVVDLLRAPPHGLPITAHTARADKFVRSQPIAAAWNAGKVLLPRHAPWLESFLGEVQGFTGVSDTHDDQVDALASAFIPYEQSRGAPTFSLTAAQRAAMPKARRI